MWYITILLLYYIDMRMRRRLQDDIIITTYIKYNIATVHFAGGNIILFTQVIISHRIFVWLALRTAAGSCDVSRI